VFAACGEPGRIDFIDTPVAIRDKYQYFTEARMEKLRADGYQAPFTALESGVGAYVRRLLEGE
jgi:ADP-L-glycero-D-manno-heptose 6-epimerase